MTHKSSESFFVHTMLDCSLTAFIQRVVQEKFFSKFFTLAKLTVIFFFHRHRVAEKCQTKRSFWRRHSQNWSTWEYRSKAQYILKKINCYWVGWNQWVSSKVMNALPFLKSGELLFTNSNPIVLTESRRHFCGVKFVKSSRIETPKVSRSFSDVRN